jgi:hypothetical protein
MVWPGKKVNKTGILRRALELKFEGKGLMG